MSARSATQLQQGLTRLMELEIGGIAGLDHLALLRDAGKEMSGPAASMMRPGTYEPGPKRVVTLARCYVRAFGFDDDCSHASLLMCIEQVGEICPASVGPHLLEAPFECSSDERLYLAMRAIPDHNGDVSVFSVGCRRNGGRDLDSRYADAITPWDPDDEVVIVLK